MASGLEMMLKALGIDPEEIKQAMTATIVKLQDGIKGLDVSLTAINKSQAEINARLERMEQHLGVTVSTDIPETRRISRQ